MILARLVCIFFVMFWFSSSATMLGSSNGQSDIMEDAQLPTDQIIRKYNYPVETHFVITSDKYILQMHRIPNPEGWPILLQHGILDSSATYILMGPNMSLGYYLFDLGYDVWLGNARGNRYSRNHTTLNPDTNELFWNFGWHEIGVFDIPAMIDYILGNTKFPKLFYAGHSQGTTVLFVMCSMRPEYNQKIILAHALAPVAFMKHVKAPLLPIAMNALQLPALGNMMELLPHTNLLSAICFLTEEICITVYYLIVGRDPQQMNRTKFPLIWAHIPAGIAIKQVRHYIQLVQSGEFRQYDYEQDNKKIYERNSPPDYELGRANVPMVLHYALNDFLSEPIDVCRLAKLLPNVVEMHQMEVPEWNHMDFLYAFEARRLLYARMHEWNKRFAIEK